MAPLAGECPPCARGPMGLAPYYPHAEFYGSGSGAFGGFLAVRGRRRPTRFRKGPTRCFTCFGHCSAGLCLSGHVSVAACSGDGGGPSDVVYSAFTAAREDPWAMAYLARLAAHTGQTEKALLYLRQALEKDPTCGPAYLFLAQLQADSACYWIERAATATLPPGAATYREKLKAQHRCS